MWTRSRRYFAMALVAATVGSAASHVWGIGFILRETKEELKLKYDVAVQDHGTGRVTIVLTLADEGRLEPLDEVQFVIPAQEKDKDGGHWMDLVVSIEMRKTNDGNRVGRVHIRKDLADRAEIQLNTHTMDGKMDPLTRLHHVIPIAHYMNSAPTAAKPAVPTPPTGPAAPAATGRAK